MAYFDENGVEVEGLLTQADLDAKLEEERTAFSTQQQAAQEAANERIISLEAEKVAAQNAVNAAASAAAAGGGSGDKEENLAALREKLEATTAALAEQKTSSETRYKAEETERVSAAIKAVAGDDVDLAAKIKHNYESMLSGVKAETSEQITQKVLSAARLSIDPVESPNALDIARAGGSRGAAPVINQGAAKPFSPAAVAVGQSLGISDADRAKYGNDPRLAKK